MKLSKLEMKKYIKTLKASYFNALYGKNEDPWNFEKSEYEHLKYKKTLELLPNLKYSSGFEIGCSNGVFSMMLKDRCHQLLSVDSSGIAAANATARLAPFPHVQVMEMEIPGSFPDDQFDLILFSEVGYFLNREDLLVTFDKIIQGLVVGGHLLLVHWLQPVEEFPLTGDEVHDIFMSRSNSYGESQLTVLKSIREPQYRMDLFEK